MRGYVTDAERKVWILPMLTEWKMEYTPGIPCDSFWLRCPWEPGSGTTPDQWVGFFAQYQEERVFTGLVDECQVSIDHRGEVLEITGRGMAARLLDNEAMGQDYEMASLEDILRDHIYPYGIQVDVGDGLKPVPKFSISTGSSEWSVIYEFARYYGGVSPRFDRWGRLVLKDWGDGEYWLLGDGTPITELVCRDTRYGVLSQVLVRDRFSGAVEKVENTEFADLGGAARRIITMPGRSNYKDMRYSGQFQLDRSEGERLRLEVTVAQPFCAWPGELVQLQRSGWERNGTYRVVNAVVSMDERGCRTWLELARPDYVI